VPTPGATTVTATDDRGVVVVTVHGDLDAAAAPVLRRHLDDLLVAGRRNFVVDLAAVGLVDGSGFRALVGFFTRVRIGHGDVRVCALQPQVARVFELLRLHRVFDAFADRDAAVAGFGLPGEG